MWGHANGSLPQKSAQWDHTKNEGQEKMLDDASLPWRIVASETRPRQAGASNSTCRSLLKDSDAMPRYYKALDLMISNHERQ